MASATHAIPNATPPHELEGFLTLEVERRSVGCVEVDAGHGLGNSTFGNSNSKTRVFTGIDGRYLLHHDVEESGHHGPHGSGTVSHNRSQGNATINMTSLSSFDSSAAASPGNCKVHLARVARDELMQHMQSARPAVTVIVTAERGGLWGAGARKKAEVFFTELVWSLPDQDEE